MSIVYNLFFFIILHSRLACSFISFEYTEINYPVVQGTDNQYYLKRLFNGKWNGSGCIFHQNLRPASGGQLPSLQTDFHFLPHLRCLLGPHPPRHTALSQYRRIEYKKRDVSSWTAGTRRICQTGTALSMGTTWKMVPCFLDWRSIKLSIGGFPFTTFLQLPINLEGA